MKARIVQCLRGSAPAPDPQAQARALLPAGIAEALFPATLVAAAVLLPLVERSAGLQVLLTRRADHLQDHPGQISFPGGRIQPGDPGPREAALREFQEELGVAAGLVDVAGYLPAHAVVTGFVVTPVVGFVPAAVRLRPDPEEVAEAFEVPLDFLLDAGNATTGTRLVRGIELPYWEYSYSGRRIWGATAQILRTLANIVN